MLAVDIDAWTPQTWAVVAAFITVAVYVVIAIYAVRQVNEARTLREEQARPFVVAEFVPGFIINFRVQNLGRTMARNVHFTWETFPVVTSQISGEVWKSADDSVLFSKGIPSLAPGQVVQTLFDQFPERVQQKLPMQYRITVDYNSYDERQHYSERFDLDLDLFLGLRSISRKDIHDVAQDLEEIKKQLNKWTAFGGGLNVLTSDKDQAARIDSRPDRLTKARRRIRNDGYRAALRAQWEDFRRRHGLYFLD